jgi:hypothetical protein
VTFNPPNAKSHLSISSSWKIRVEKVLRWYLLYI